MLAEPTKVVKEENLNLPKVSTGKGLPSFTDEQIWRFVGERGVYSDDPRYFKYCFDTLVHRNGILMYRMKPQKEWFFKVKTKNNSQMFGGTMFHDPMESFITRENPDFIVESDYLVLMNTHTSDGEEKDVLENWCCVPYDQFKSYLDPKVPMDDLTVKVENYLKEKMDVIAKEIANYREKQIVQEPNQKKLKKK
jgi:hypothetical protein